MTTAAQAREDEEMWLRKRFRDDLSHYAKCCLKIRPKDGGLIPFDLNEVQLEVHRRLQKQLKETGSVRALILKCRQPGISTYSGGRFYHRVTHEKGIRAFILTHDQDATDNLFNITARFHEHCPDVLKPHTGKSNAKELVFDSMESDFRVGTAGTRGVGRSQTIQLFHGSEVAHWPNAEDHMDGVIQAVPDKAGTEIILESTANGIGGLFHAMCKAAERGDNEYNLIFVPWLHHLEYHNAPP